MDLLPGALVVQQQLAQRTDQQTMPDYQEPQRSRLGHGRAGRALRRGFGRVLIAAGTAIVRWAEPLPTRPAQRT